MQRRLRLRDLHLAGGEAAEASPFLQPASEERLAAAVLAAHGLEGAAPEGDRIQLGVERGLEALHADGEGREPVPRDGTPTERIEDACTAMRARHQPLGSSNCTRRSSPSSVTVP